MATDFINYASHGVVEISKLKATECGHYVNLLVDEDAGIDNGSFVTFDITSDTDGYGSVALGIDVLGKALVPSVGDPVYLVASMPMIYEDYTPAMREERNFYNGKGEIARCAEIVRGDCFALSKECFTNPEAAALGKYISVDGTGYKATVSDNAPDGVAFVGYIYAQAANGNWYVYVTKNGGSGSGETDPVVLYFQDAIMTQQYPMVTFWLLENGENIPSGITWSVEGEGVTWSGDPSLSMIDVAQVGESIPESFIVKALYKEKTYSVTVQVSWNDEHYAVLFINDQLVDNSGGAYPLYKEGDVLRIYNGPDNKNYERMEMIVVQRKGEGPNSTIAPIKTEVISDSNGKGYVIVEPVTGIYRAFGVVDGYPLYSGRAWFQIE